MTVLEALRRHLAFAKIHIKFGIFYIKELIQKKSGLYAHLPLFFRVFFPTDRFLIFLKS
jgi:hypothetical protein